MDALVPAFVAALLAGIADRPARLAAMLGTSGRISGVVAGLALGHALAIAISVAGALAIAPLMAPNARALLLAVALILTGFSGIRGRAAPTASRNTGFIAAATGSFIGGDGTAFLAFALAVKGSAPVLAGVGALAGALLLGITAAVMGRDWERVPLLWLGRVAGGLLLVTGVIVGLTAMRLI